MHKKFEADVSKRRRMRFPTLLTLVATIAGGSVALAQMPTYHLGKAPNEEEIRARDTVVGPRGKELPRGKGTVKDGALLFAKKCVACHGQNGQGTKLAPKIVGEEEVLSLPFATAIWSYIYNAMPRK